MTDTKTDLRAGAPAPDDRTLGLVLRSTAFNIAFYVNITVLMIVCLPNVLLGRARTLGVARLWARSSLWLLDKICGTRFEFRGRENLPAGGVIVAAKHQSTLETFALTLAVGDFSYVLKRELMWLPLFGWYLKGAEQIAIDRSSGRSALQQIIARAREIFAQGRVLLIFPEGTRRLVDAPAQYKSGVAHVYLDCGVPCVPVALNTGLFWPRHGFLRRPGTVVVEFLPAIAPGLDKEAFQSRLQNAIETQTDRLVAEARAAARP